MPDLATRNFGRTGMKPSALALGAAFLHGTDEAVQGIRLALDLGINYLDSYPGHHEEHWGKALSGVPRDSYYLQAKVGTHPDRRKDFSAETTRWSVEGSLRAMKVDYLDSVLIHDPDSYEDPTGPGRVLDTLLEMKEKGLVRNIGLGTRDLKWHKQLIESGHADLLLTFLDYTLLSQTAADEIFQTARSHDTGIILASAQGMGLLTGPEPDSDRESAMYPGKQPTAHRIWAWCQENGVNIRHLAVQYCLKAPVESIVMVGPSSVQQVREAYEAATTDLPEEVWLAFETEFGIERGYGAG
jgi:aryl-alcohol dehydrogenase-like predicted oxidoreductase